jgi:hypothetical protein
MTRSRQTADWGSRAGLAKIVPSSVAVGSGTGSATALGTVTFSGASSVSLNDVFNSTYRNYRIICNFVSTTGSNSYTSIRMRASNADESGTNYKFAAIGYRSNNTAYNDYSGASSNATAWQDLGTNASSTTNNFFVFDVINPNESMYTLISGKSLTYDTASSGILADVNYTGMHVQGTAYTGFTAFPSAGTISGDVSVYGYTK